MGRFENAEVFRDTERMFEAAVAYAGRMRTCAHNFASATNPGDSANFDAFVNA